MVNCHCNPITKTVTITTQRYAATASLRPLYDPKSERMKS